MEMTREESIISELKVMSQGLVPITEANLMQRASECIKELVHQVEVSKAECARLALRNAMLVIECDRHKTETVIVKTNVENAIRRALYEGEG